MYCGVIGLIFLAMLGIYCFGKMPSERFGNLSSFYNYSQDICWACLGIYVRNFAVLTRLLSWVGLLLMAI